MEELNIGDTVVFTKKFKNTKDMFKIDWNVIKYFINQKGLIIHISKDKSIVQLDFSQPNGYVDKYLYSYKSEWVKKFNN